MRIDLIRSMEELLSRREFWDGILAENRNCIPFMEMDWIKGWWDLFGDQYDLHVLQVTEEDKTVGFCPFMMTKGGFIKHLYFIGYPQANSMDFLFTNTRRGRAMDGVVRYLMRINGAVVIHLNGIPQDSPNMPLLSSCLSKYRGRYFSRKITTRYLTIEGRPFHILYKERRRQHHSIRNIDKSEKRLQKLGKVIFAPIEEKDMDQIFTLHEGRWKKKIDTSGFTKAKSRELFTRLARHEAGPNFHAVVDGLYLNGRLLAFLYGFRCGNQYLLYCMGHDEDFASFGPGKILLKRKIEECFQKRVEVFDFGVGEERYKAEWTDQTDFVLNIAFPARHWAEYLSFLKHAAVEKCIDILKRNRRIVHFKRNTLGRLRYCFSRESLREFFIKKAVGCMGRLFRHIYSREEVIIYRMNRLSGSSSRNGTFTVRKAVVDDLETLEHFTGMARSEIIQRFYKGHICLLMKQNEDLRFIGWVCPNRIELPGIPYSRDLGKGYGCLYETDGQEDWDCLSFLLAESFACLEQFDMICLPVKRKSRKLMTAAQKAGFTPWISLTVARRLFLTDCREKSAEE